jgi:predicted nucleotidyltransferase
MVTLYTALVGSRLHRLHTDESDYDYRQVFMRDLRYMVSPFNNREPVENPDESAEKFDLIKFMKMAAGGNGTVLEVLYSDISTVHPYFAPVKNNLVKFLDSTKILHAHSGYANEQVKKYLSKAAENFSIVEEQGLDVRMRKATVAAIRIVHQAKQLLSTKNLEPNIWAYNSKLAEWLFKIKTTPTLKSRLESNVAWIKEELEALEAMKYEPFSADLQWIEDYVVDLYSERL